MLKHPSCIIGLFVVPLFLLLLGCGTNSSYAPSSSSSLSSSIGPPPVQAASGFTNATLSGGYAFGVVGTSGIQAQAGNGVAVADGNGNITSGDETLNIGGTMSCHATLTGTYSVNTNGTGTATATVTMDAASQANGCGTSSIGHFTLAIGNGGSTVFIAEQDTGGTFVATAIKQ